MCRCGNGGFNGLRRHGGKEDLTSLVALVVRESGSLSGLGDDCSGTGVRWGLGGGGV